MQGGTIQRHDKKSAFIPRKCTRRKQVKRELILSFFWFNVGRWEKHIDVKRPALLKELPCIFGSLETVMPESWQSIKGDTIAFLLSSLSKCLSTTYFPIGYFLFFVAE